MMDISETYIKMCEKAEKIQKEWKPEEGDFLTWRGYLPNYTIFVVESHHVDKELAREHSIEPIKREDYLWLPRQDQLQEMMLPELDKRSELGKFIGCTPYVLNDWLKESLGTGIYKWGRSYEELWLAFVMKEKFGKVWDGENWVEG